MKKFLLSLFVCIIGFVGFSSAGSITFSDLVFDPGITVLYSFDTKGKEIGDIKIDYVGVSKNLFFCLGRNSCTFNMGIKSGDGIILYNYSSSTSLDVVIRNTNSSPVSVSSITIDNHLINSPIVSDPKGSFSPVIVGIYTVLSEFIPYVVYIGFGVLIVILGYLALKWLMSWIYYKVIKYFK